MSLSEQILQLPWWMLIVAAVAAGWVVKRGWWRRSALGDVPSRAIGLGVDDLLLGGFLMLGGMMLGGTLVGPYRDAPLTLYLLTMIGGQLLSLGLPAAYLALRAIRQDDGLRRIGLVPRHVPGDLRVGVIGALLAVMIVPGVIVLFAILGLMLGLPAPELAHDLLLKLRDSDSMSAVVLLCISAVLVAPVLEETVYRGLWQSLLVESLGEQRRRSAIAIAAAIFASVHLGSVSWQAMPALWVLGLMLGWIYERTGSLLPGVIVHAVFNAANITVVLLLGPGPYP
ncbi:MAG: CPBP family intramembrane metalloprotease [Phycisphaeraceae bacterium]|nr:CPBP family intramembrane metalloprotease [Phycisphaeraceae bacterium]